MRILRPNSVPASAPADRVPHNKKTPQLAEAAVMLLPALHHARSLLDIAIRILHHFANEPSQAPPNAAGEAAKVRRLLAAFGHPPIRR